MIDILNFHIVSVCSSFLVLPGKEAEKSIVPLPKDPTNISLIFTETCVRMIRKWCATARGEGGEETQSSISHHRLLNILHPRECCWLKKKKISQAVFQFSYLLYISFFVHSLHLVLFNGWRMMNLMARCKQRLTGQLTLLVRVIRLNLIKENNFSIFKFGLLKTTYWTATTHIRHSAGIANTCDWFTPEVWNIRRIQSNVLCNAKPADPFHHHRLTCSA